MTASYGHDAKQWGFDDFTISWIVDKHYSGSRLRFPQHQRRVTDRKGAERFCKRWEIEMPEERIAKEASK